MCLVCLADATYDLNIYIIIKLLFFLMLNINGVQSWERIQHKDCSLLVATILQEFFNIVLTTFWIDC